MTSPPVERAEHRLPSLRIGQIKRTAFTRCFASSESLFFACAKKGNQRKHTPPGTPAALRAAGPPSLPGFPGRAPALSGNGAHPCAPPFGSVRQRRPCLRGPQVQRPRPSSAGTGTGHYRRLAQRLLEDPHRRRQSCCRTNRPKAGRLAFRGPLRHGGCGGSNPAGAARTMRAVFRRRMDVPSKNSRRIREPAHSVGVPGGMTSVSR